MPPLGSSSCLNPAEPPTSRAARVKDVACGRKIVLWALQRVTSLWYYIFICAMCCVICAMLSTLKCGCKAIKGFYVVLY
jgi:hypothetical protein